MNTVFSFFKVTILLIVCGGFSVFIDSIAYADNSLTPGPGLFSGESGEFLLLKTDKKLTKVNKASLPEQKPIAINDDAEFDLYKQWQKARAEKTEDYQAFLYWLQYQEYQRRRQK